MRFQGLGRKENPTERAIVEVVHPDGTYDCRVPGRPHPYTRLQTCGGQRPLHVGQTVEVAFVDYQRTGRRWMPFILGASKSHLESGMSRGRVSRGLAWHNGADGTPDYTGSLYSLDTGYRKWKHDAGWSIPGPWDAIIGYTVDQGYILTVHGKDVRCYLAENGTPFWEYELPLEGSKPIYNPARREVVFLNTKFNDARVDAILEATTGHVLAGSQTLPKGIEFSGSYRVFIFGDRLYVIVDYSRANSPSGSPSRVWDRDTSAGYVLRGAVELMEPDIPWPGHGDSYFRGLRCAIDGRMAYSAGGHRSYVMSFNGLNFTVFRAWASLGLLDLATGVSTTTDVVHGPPPLPHTQDGQTGVGSVLSVSADVKAMSPDGYMCGEVHTAEAAQGEDGRPIFRLASHQVVWDPHGTRLQAGPMETGGVMSAWFLSSPSRGALAAVHDRTTDINSISRNLSVIWSLPSGDRFTGHGGESLKGEASWVLVASPGGWHFRDFKTGTVLGPWAGSMPVMVSAGIIYDTDDDGNLRRWTE